ncbi:MAG: class I SAM-dependent methyltransferase [Eubacteriaceae bacterium]|nr:class I SAM-dependent methyltransferase [Eubacteriaceae bacterium]
MSYYNAYESDTMWSAMGNMLRPGNFDLTDIGVKLSKFSPQDKVLDLGCGRGATVAYLNEKYDLSAVGIDSSEKMIKNAREEMKNGDFILGRGENLPFRDEIFQGVFAECTLSLMDDLDSTLKEVHRVLKNHGYLIITDVYARGPGYVSELEAFSLNSCMKGLHDLDHLREKLDFHGFKVEYFEDQSKLLTDLMIKIIFSYGSMANFWESVTNGNINGYHLQDALKICKPGYFIMVVRKGVK